jgi:hypothetical protein
MKQKSKQVCLPLTHALAWIVGSSLLVSGTAHLCLKHYMKQKSQPRQVIHSIVQTGPQREALKTEYLAEVLGISIDRPVYFTSFDLKAAELKLLHSPLINQARVKALPPNALYVDYTIRQPIAWLYDYENIAIDKEGYPFPFRPFFSPKNLPEIYFGMPAFSIRSEDPDRPMAAWCQPLKGKYITLAFDLLALMNSPQVSDLFRVKRIDVSNAFAESCGKREIVLIVEDTIIQQQGGKEVQFTFPKILRLSTKNYAQELGNYLTLREKLVETERQSIRISQGKTHPIRQKEKVIDFRIPNLAFIDGDPMYTSSD